MSHVVKEEVKSEYLEYVRMRINTPLTLGLDVTNTHTPPSGPGKRHIVMNDHRAFPHLWIDVVSYPLF